MVSSTARHTNGSRRREDIPLETFTLIWLDANAGAHTNRDIEAQLRAIINHVKKFDDADECTHYIEQAGQDDRFVVLVSGQFDRQVVACIHELEQVSAVYITPEDKESDEQWAHHFFKIKSIKTNLGTLISRINEDYRHRNDTEELHWISMYTTITDAETTTTRVNDQFVFSQLLIDCLLRLPPNEMDRTKLIDRCKEEYEGNHAELSNLDEFQNDYSPDKALWWYTRDSFCYKTLNAALQKQNIHMMFMYRSFITDIYHQLQQSQSKCSVRVYRNQRMSIDELHDLQQHHGQLISVTSFLSGTRRKPTGDSYRGTGTENIASERVLFEIDADPKLVTMRPFADVSKHSDFFLESEVLFMPGSIFRLNTIDYDDNQGWIIGMSLCADDDQSLKEVVGHVKKQNGTGEIDLYTFCKMLWKMGKFDLATTYYMHCINKLEGADNPLLLQVYDDLAEIASQQNNYDKSIEWQQRLSDAEKQLQTRNSHVTSQPLAKSPKTNNRFMPRYLSLGCVVLLLVVLGVGIYSWSAGRSRTKNKNSHTRGSNHSMPNTRKESLQLRQELKVSEVAFPKELGIQWNKVGITIVGGNEVGYQLDGPQGIFVDNDTTIYIADTFNHRVVQWKPNQTNGQVIAGRNGYGHGDDQLSYPQAVIVDKRSRSWIICDSMNKRVIRFSQRNVTDREILISNIHCSGLAMGKDGSLYVSDMARNEVRRWRKGNVNTIIVAGGNGKGSRSNQLNAPTYLFVDGNDSLYISDMRNHRVLKWRKGAKAGVVVAGGNGQGNNATQLSNPHGIIVDDSGEIYVADCWNSRIMQWCEKCSTGSVAIGEDIIRKQSNQFFPTGLSFDTKWNLYVADQENNRVQRFDRIL